MNAAVAKRIRWTVRDYLRMSEVGLFDDRRVELIEGVVVRVPAQGYPHALAITKTSRLFFQAFPTTTSTVLVQATFPLPPYGAPDPDLHVFDAPEGTPQSRLPLPFVVIEVSDTTYLKDSGPKLRMYARAGIVDYWIVNINERRVEVYRRPENPTGKRSGWRYADVTFHTPGGQVQPLARPQVSFAVDAMLP